MADKLMYIPNDLTQNYLSLGYNYWLKPINTQLDEPTNKNLKSPQRQVLSQLIIKFGNQCNKQPNVPSLPVDNYASRKVIDDYVSPGRNRMNYIGDLLDVRKTKECKKDKKK